MGCCCGEGNTTSFKEITLQVSGMSCGHCQKAVKDALCKLEGVKDVQVDLDCGCVKIQYNPMLVSLLEFKKSIQDAGYEVL